MAVSGLLRGAYPIAQRGAAARFLPPRGDLGHHLCADLGAELAAGKRPPGGLRGRAEQVRQQRAAIGQPALVALFGRLNLWAGRLDGKAAAGDAVADACAAQLSRGPGWAWRGPDPRQGG